MLVLTFGVIALFCRLFAVCQIYFCRYQKAGLVVKNIDSESIGSATSV